MNVKVNAMSFSLYNTLNSKFADRLTPQLQRKATLIVLSHALEDAVIENGLKPVIFTAFQEARYFSFESARYQELGKVARAVTLYGKDIPNTTEELEFDWFVVVNEPRFKALMACRELKEHDEETNRTFLGVWSYDREVVDYACRVLVERAVFNDKNMLHSLEEVLNTPYQPLEQINYAREVGEKILNEMARTNQKAISQISRNQQLLSDLEEHEELLQQLNQKIARVRDERTTLQAELKKLYDELMRSQQIMTESLIEKARFEQQRGLALAMLRQLEAEYALVKNNPMENQGLSRIEALINQLQQTLNQK